MSEEDIRNLENIAIEKIKNGVTREEALESFIRAGILDKNGNYTEPYKILEKAIRK